MKESTEARERFLNDLHQAQSHNDLAHLLSHHMFERTPALFEDDQAAWIDWKTQLAKGLEVDPLSVLLVGSAALGFSPMGDLHLFGPKSDVDVAVVSPRHFDIAWHKLRFCSDHSEGMQLFLNEHRMRYIYWGTVATDLKLLCFNFGRRWQSALSNMRQKKETLNRDISVRIYRDPAALRDYQVNTLTKTKHGKHVTPGEL